MASDKTGLQGRQVQLELSERAGLVRQRGQASAPAAEPHVLPVSEVVRLASRQLERRFYDVWVEGEVSNLRRPSSGHMYFTLKDAAAQLAVVAFRSTLLQLGFCPEDGQLLRCRGRLGIYEPQGRFQLTLDHAEPAGLGALQLAFERLKRKLLAEGLFDEAHKKSLPMLPRRIALVTSRTGAALRDILTVLRTRCPVEVILCPAAVQGTEAPREICAALRQADGLVADLIILGRGGGSIEDLWAFNDEGVARCIHRLRTPVISAVGHEIDFVIADFVADVRAATPSAAAEIAVPVIGDLEQQVAVLRGRLVRGMRQHVQRQQLQLERLRGQLGSPRGAIDRGRMQLDDAVGRMQRLQVRRLRHWRDQLARLQLRLSANRPATRLQRHRGELEALRARLEGGVLAHLLSHKKALEALWAGLEHAGPARLTEARGELARLATALHALSPLAVLGRGYSLARDANGRLVRDATMVSVGDRLGLQLAQGALDCRVERVHHQAASKKS